MFLGSLLIVARIQRTRAAQALCALWAQQGHAQPRPLDRAIDMRLPK